jgi:GntR family transcriptional regulator of vanillate catabolism
MPESKSQNLTKRATYELRQRIIHGGLPGGTRLYEVALSEELQISRTPVREAMSRLAAEGLLERATGGGFLVRAFSLADVTDAIELRGVLEGTAARLAAERGADPAALAAIRQVLAGLDACFGPGDTLDFDAYSELNARFHSALAGLCGSAVIRRELERVTSLPFASPSAFVLGQADAARSHQSLVMAQAQHRALVEAIARREGARAEALAREHARIALGNLSAAFGAGVPAPVPGMALIRR